MNDIKHSLNTTTAPAPEPKRVVDHFTHEALEVVYTLSEIVAKVRAPFISDTEKLEMIGEASVYALTSMCELTHDLMRSATEDAIYSQYLTRLEQENRQLKEAAKAV